jgi:hypothetical protein
MSALQTAHDLVHIASLVAGTSTSVVPSRFRARCMRYVLTAERSLRTIALILVAMSRSARERIWAMQRLFTDYPILSAVSAGGSGPPH